MIRVFRVAPRKSTKKLERHLQLTGWTVLKVSESHVYGILKGTKFHGERLIRAVPTSWFNSLSEKQQTSFREDTYGKLGNGGATA